MLHLKSLSVRYGSKNIVKNLTFSFKKGEVYVISGASGSGKSTLFYAINGIIPAFYTHDCEGTVVYGSHTLSHKTIVERSQYIGSMLQNPNAQIIFDTVAEELAFVLENANTPVEQIPEHIEAFSKRMGLEPHWKTNTLSGGEKQRLIIAETLCMQQPIVILDEPFASVDDAGAKIILDEVFALQQKGVTVIIIEHRLELLYMHPFQFLRLENYQLVQESCPVPETLVPSNYTNDPQGEDLIRLHNISKRFGQKVIFDNFSLSIKRGGRYVINGRNGVGKSTLFKILMGIEKIQSGTRWTAFSKKEFFNKVSFVMQDPDYQLCMSTVLEELSLNCPDKAFLDELISVFHFEPLLDRHPHSLSQGQKRRLGVACALVKKPVILFMDEPSVGQDSENLDNMLSAIERLYDKYHTTLITITHDHRCSNLLGERIMIESPQS